MAGGNAAQDTSVIFCMDTSGSMCVTEPVRGKHNIKGDKQMEMLREMQRQFGDGSDQFLGNDNNVTYVSRI